MPRTTSSIRRRQHGPEARTLTLRNEVQKALFERELQGQISDGYWENARPYNHWQPWCSAQVVVGKNVGRNFLVSKENYSFDAPILLSVIGDRMLEICRSVAGEDFTMAQMRAELRDMKKIIRERSAPIAVGA